MIIMRKNRPLCEFDSKSGLVKNINELPLDLFLEESEDFDTRLNNSNNFNHWCASRVLSLDRIHAKAILNSCALKQGQTDKERAQIALSYKCLSLHDSYWVKSDDKDDWDKINLFDHSLNDAVDVSLQGRSLTLNNTMLIASDCATDGIAPKAWVRKDGELFMLKGNLPGSNSVEKEVEASKMLQKLGIDVLNYDFYKYKGHPVAASKCYTTKDISQISLGAYQENHSFLEQAKDKDIYDLHILNLCDYLSENIDRHWGNINFLYDDSGILGFSKPMDFNHSFEAKEAQICLPMKYIYNKEYTQKEAAVAAIKYTGISLPDIKLEEFSYGANVKNRIFSLEQELKKDFVFVEHMENIEKNEIKNVTDEHLPRIDSDELEL